MNDNPKILCVDMDGTLVKTDLLHENIFHALKANPLMIFPMVGWLFKGKKYFKDQMDRRIGIHFESLPYNQQVIDFIRQQKANQSKIYLVSANTASNVNGVTNALNLFDGVFCSDLEKNLKGDRKADFLVEKFGQKGFDYVGDHCCDMPVFKASGQAYLVSSCKGLEGYFKKKGITFAKTFIEEKNSIKVFLKTIRIHQWSKNVLIFLPLLLSHRFIETALVIKAMGSFLAFSLMASSTYVINDLFDLTSDRMHSSKKSRPIASGSVSLGTAIAWAMMLFIGAMVLASSISVALLKFMLIYSVVTLTYSFRLKKIVIMDVLVLAFLYTLRILIGAWVLHIPLSEWLFSFSIFLFCSLGFLKRNNEMIGKVGKLDDVKSKIPGRGYLVDDLSIIQLFGITTGVAAVLIFVLYINSEQVKLLYRINYWLWLVAPILLYWIARMWLIASRGKMHEDPVVFAIKDKGGYVVFMLIAVCMMLAKFGFMPI